MGCRISAPRVMVLPRICALTGTNASHSSRVISCSWTPEDGKGCRSDVHRASRDPFGNLGVCSLDPATLGVLVLGAPRLSIWRRGGSGGVRK
jgi:hypothetical protein